MAPTARSMRYVWVDIFHINKKKQAMNEKNEYNKRTYTNRERERERERETEKDRETESMCLNMAIFLKLGSTSLNISKV